MRSLIFRISAFVPVILFAFAAQAQDASADGAAAVQEKQAVTAGAPDVAPAPADDKAAAEKADSSLLSFLKDGPAKIEKGPFSLKFHARIQAWGGWVGEDAGLKEGDRMQEYGFRLRRARFGIDGQLVKNITYKLELDLFDQEKTGGPLYEAWINYEPTHYFGMRVGMTKFLYSKEEMMSSGGLAHLDSSVASRAMAPGAQMGLVLYSSPIKDKLHIMFGVYNGVERGERTFFEGYEGIGVSLGNKFERLSYAGRIDAEPMGPLGWDIADIANSDPRIGFGAAAMYSPGKTRAIVGASGYVHLKAKGFHLMAEALWDRSTPQPDPTLPTNESDTVEHLTFAGSVGYVIPKVNLGIALRSEYINDDMSDATEGDVLLTAVSMSFYAYEHFLKVQLEYQNRYELDGVSVSNDAAIAGVQLMF